MGGGGMSIAPVAVEAQAAMLPRSCPKTSGGSKHNAYRPCTSPPADGRFVCSDCQTISVSGYRR
jgi:hypothetical protein